MKKLLVAALVAACFAASAAQFMSLRTRDASLTLTPNPCPPEVSEQLRDEFVSQFKEAWVVIQGKTAVGCWIKDDDTVFVILENGQAFGVPAGAFKADNGV